MSNAQESSFFTSLQNFTEPDWMAALVSLLPSIHEVDRNAVQIWFRFYPLSLQRFLDASADLEDAKRSIAMQGDFGLRDKIDTSHAFLYGHRFWNQTRDAIASRVANGSPVVAIADEISAIADEVSTKTGAEKGLTLSIAAAGLMTLVQVGPESFKAAKGSGKEPMGLLSKSPASVVESRKRDDSQGIFGFLKTIDKKYSVTHDETSGLRFPIVSDQEIASASASDRSKDWQSKDARCWEGPVPVECTSASCGTCWVGVVAGREKLSEVGRREQRAIKVFGYNETDSDKPLIRLACQAKAYGNVTIVIPPWNAVFGKKVYGNVEELELEPVTTSAKHLREITKEATAAE